MISNLVSGHLLLGITGLSYLKQNGLMYLSIETKGLRLKAHADLLYNERQTTNNVLASYSCPHIPEHALNACFSAKHVPRANGWQF